MAALNHAVRDSYSAAQSMPQPPYADGPWGVAIRYWLTVRKLRQADLARPIAKGGAGVDSTTVSRVTRGFDTTTRILRRIAAALNVTVEDILVSPQRLHEGEERRRLAIEIAERVLRDVDRGLTPTGDPETAIDTLARQAIEKERQQQQLKRPSKRRPAKKIRRSKS